MRENRTNKDYKAKQRWDRGTKIILTITKKKRKTKSRKRQNEKEKERDYSMACAEPERQDLLYEPIAYEEKKKRNPTSCTS